MFLRIHRKHLQSIYAFLRQGGVYVCTKEKCIIYAQLLFEITQEEQQHSWTQENLNKVYIKLNRNRFQLNKINNALKHGLNYKVLQDLTVYITLF